MPVLGSSESEWLASVVSCIWTLLTTLILGSPGGEWLLLQAALNFLVNLFFNLGCVCPMCSTLCQIY